MRTAIVATTVLLALAGCSSSSDTPSSSPSASQAASLAAPIVVDPGQTEVTAAVGQFIDFNVGAKPGRWQVSSDNTAVLTVTPGGKNGSATFNPGAEAIAAGTATVTMTDKKGDLDAMVYSVTVTQ